MVYLLSPTSTADTPLLIIWIRSETPVCFHQSSFALSLQVALTLILCLRPSHLSPSFVPMHRPAAQNMSARVPLMAGGFDLPDRGPFPPDSLRATPTFLLLGCAVLPATPQVYLCKALPPGAEP